MRLSLINRSSLYYFDYVTGQLTMIAQIHGRLLLKEPPLIMVDTGALAYELEVPMSTLYGLPEIGEAITLWTHFVVREDAQLLFGFARWEERHLFRLLLKVSGIGGRLAIAILSSFSVEDFYTVVQAQDTAALRKIPGVGPKMAGRLLLELRDRQWSMSSAHARQDTVELSAALSALGYTDKEVHRALSQVDTSLSLSEQIRQALSYLSRV